MESSTRAILVAGCSHGFGFRAARELALRGHAVVAGFRDPEGRNAEAAEALGEFADTHGHRLLVVRLDVTDERSVYAAVEQALAWNDGELDAVVNSAAYSVMGPLEACPPEQLRAELDTNVVGALRLLRAVLPHMRARRRGRFVQITSGLGRAAVPFMGPYSVSAWAQECFAEVLSYEAAAFGIDVAIIEPAAYRDDMGGPPVKPVGDADRLAAYQDQLVAFAEALRAEEDEPAGDPDEVARAVADAVEAESVPLRTPVGESARRLVDLRNGRTTGEYSTEILRRTGLLPFVKKKG
jgi:NAD(P)-dependent dehydrogenase (short-subunit alcohol dehydrogenase family)